MSYRIDRTPKRIRVRLGDDFVADTTQARLAYVQGRHPEYLLAVSDVRLEQFSDDGPARHDDLGRWRPIRSADGAALVGRRYEAGPADGYITFDFDAMGAWFEEAEEIFFHPRDPYRRVDVIESDRHVEVRVDSEVVAATSRPRLVTETALPPRWYIPRADVNWAMLRDSSTTSGCQYKGIANWWHVATSSANHADVAWGYERPVAESAKLVGLVAFYAEHAAVETFVDGVAQERPILDGRALNPSLGLTG